MLDGLFGAGAGPALAPAEPLAPGLEALVQALAEGHEPEAALGLAGFDAGADAGLAALASLELAGRVRREAGGRFSVLP